MKTVLQEILGVLLGAIYIGAVIAMLVVENDVVSISLGTCLLFLPGIFCLIFAFKGRGSRIGKLGRLLDHFGTAAFLSLSMLLIVVYGWLLVVRI